MIVNNYSNTLQFVISVFLILYIYSSLQWHHRISSIRPNIFCIINSRVSVWREITESLISRMTYLRRGARRLPEKKPFTYSSRVCERHVTNSDRVLLVKSAHCWPEETDCPRDRLRFISRMRDCLKLRPVQSVYDLQEPLKNFRVKDFKDSKLHPTSRRYNEILLS